MCGSSLGAPDEQFIVFDDLHSHPRTSSKACLMQQCNTLLWLPPAECTSEIRPIDAGNEHLFKVHVGKALDKWLLDADEVEFWESKKLTASQRRIIFTQWVGEAAKKIDVEMGVEYRRRLFEKTDLAITADGNDDNLINLEGMDREFSFMDSDSTPEPLEDVLPASPAPANEEHPSGSSDEEDDSDEKGGESNSGANDELATLDVDDKLAEGEEPLPLEIPTGYVLASSAPAALAAELVKRPVVLQLGIGWLKGIITRQAQARTRHL